MRYSDAVEQLYALGAELHAPPGQPRRKFELGQMRVLMARLGDPQARFRSVLVAGTNGKGSTAATLASILGAAGERAGLYTSPHLIRVNERIQLFAPERREIADEEFARGFTQVDEAARALAAEGALPQMPSFFEVMTAMAFLYFAEHGVELAVLEVGLGGRLDATNIVDPLVSVITDISLDHMEWLGSTVSEIAREKAGILRAGGVMVTLPQHPEANQVLGEVAVALDVRGVNAAQYLPVREAREHERAAHGRNQYEVYAGSELLQVDSPLAGEHQQRNLALAIATAHELRNKHGYIIPREAIEKGIRSVHWPGRLERMHRAKGEAEVLLDVGHNPAGAWALRAALSSEERLTRTLVFGCLRDKPVRELAQILFPLFDRVVLTKIDSPRAESLEVMGEAAAAVGIVPEMACSPEAALERALEATPAEGQVVVTGSVFLVGAALSLLRGKMQEQASA